jgi:hypothetical protein
VSNGQSGDFWHASIARLRSQQAIAETAHHVSDGLLSSEEADRLYHGRMV